jgi:hypothetical protein
MLPQSEPDTTYSDFGPKNDSVFTVRNSNGRKKKNEWKPAHCNRGAYIYLSSEFTSTPRHCVVLYSFYFKLVLEGAQEEPKLVFEGAQAEHKVQEAQESQVGQGEPRMVVRVVQEVQMAKGSQVEDALYNLNLSFSVHLYFKVAGICDIDYHADRGCWRPARGTIRSQVTHAGRVLSTYRRSCEY